MPLEQGHLAAQQAREEQALQPDPVKPVLNGQNQAHRIIDLLSYSWRRKATACHYCRQPLTGPYALISQGKYYDISCAIKAGFDILVPDGNREERRLSEE